MKDYTYFVLFSIDSDKFAIPYERVIEATKSAEITPLPYPTKRILGIVNFHGKIAPVINIRKLMKRQENELELSNSFIFLNSQNGSSMAIIADMVHELVKPPPESITAMDSILPDYDLYEGTIKIGELLVPILNVEKLLSKKEKATFETVAAALPGK